MSLSLSHMLGKRQPHLSVTCMFGPARFYMCCVYASLRLHTTHVSNPFVTFHCASVALSNDFLGDLSMICCQFWSNLMHAALHTAQCQQASLASVLKYSLFLSVNMFCRLLWHMSHLSPLALAQLGTSDSFSLCWHDHPSPMICCCRGVSAMAAWQVSSSATSAASETPAPVAFTRIAAADQRQVQTVISRMSATRADSLKEAASTEVAPVKMPSSSAWPASYGVSAGIAHMLLRCTVVQAQPQYASMFQVSACLPSFQLTAMARMLLRCSCPSTAALLLYVICRVTELHQQAHK